MQQFLQHTPAEPMALEITGYHDVPQHGTTEAVGGGAPEAHQSFAAPQAHHGITAREQAAKLAKAASPGPEGVAIKQPLQLEQRPRRAEIRTDAEPAQAWGARCMVNQPDRSHGLHRQRVSSCPLVVSLPTVGSSVVGHDAHSCSP